MLLPRPEEANHPWQPALLANLERSQCPCTCPLLRLWRSKQNEDRYALEVADAGVESGVPEASTLLHSRLRLLRLLHRQACSPWQQGCHCAAASNACLPFPPPLRRPAQVYAAVFDGHGGSATAEWLQDNLLKYVEKVGGCCKKGWGGGGGGGGGSKARPR